MHNSHIAKLKLVEASCAGRKKKKKEENKLVCKLQITDYSMNHGRNKLKIIDW